MDTHIRNKLSLPNNAHAQPSTVPVWHRRETVRKWPTQWANCLIKMAAKQQQNDGQIQQQNGEVQCMPPPSSIFLLSGYITLVRHACYWVQSVVWNRFEYTSSGLFLVRSCLDLLWRRRWNQLYGFFITAQVPNNEKYKKMNNFITLTRH